MLKQHLSLTLFYLLVLLFVFPYKTYGSLQSYPTIPNEFLCRTKNIMCAFNSDNPFLTRFSNSNTREKEKLEAMFDAEIVDIFDVIFSPKDSLLIRNSLLAYAKYKALLSDINKLNQPNFLCLKGLFLTIEANENQLIDICSSTPQLNSLTPLLESILNPFSTQKSKINSLLAELQLAKNQEMLEKQNRSAILNTIHSADETQKELLKSKFNIISKNLKKATNQLNVLTTNLTKILTTIYVNPKMKDLYQKLQSTALELNKSYLDNITKYYQRLKIISPAASQAALFGLSILQKVTPDIQIAYIVAPNRNTEQELRKLASDTTLELELDDDFLLQWKLATSFQKPTYVWYSKIISYRTYVYI